MSPRKPAPFPWDDVMALCLGRLGWTPEAFWRSTPREIAAAMRGLRGRTADMPDRVMLDALLRRYPDA